MWQALSSVLLTDFYQRTFVIYLTHHTLSLEVKWSLHVSFYLFTRSTLLLDFALEWFMLGLTEAKLLNRVARFQM